ncbi:MAG: LuxR C-terminal-related transcriptional regulator [Mycobacteriales bacterium]
MEDLVGRAGDLLAASSVDEGTGHHLFAALGEVSLRVSDAVLDGQLSSARALEATRLAGTLQGMLRDHLRQTQSEAFARVQDVLAEAAEGASPAELLARAPAALCEALAFDRALLSRVEGSSWVPRLLHTVAGESPELADLLTGLQIPLKAGMVETDAVRRRTAALVEDAHSDVRTYRPLVAVGDLGSYVVAPVVVADRVVGLLHADTAASGRVLTRTDRDLTRMFADRFGRAYEAAVTSERVAEQRERLRQAFRADDLDVPALDPTVVRFARATPEQTTAVEVATLSTAPPPPTGPGSLTPREREILALVARGATNVQIAEELVLSESTVKSHVKRILRKLPAANRAEAAFLHHQARATGQLR